MDKLSSSLTAACKLEEWPAVARVHMLELLEMRSMAWAPSESVTQYYRQKLQQIEARSLAPQPRTAPVQLNCEAKEFNPSRLRQSRSVDNTGASAKEELSKPQPGMTTGMPSKTAKKEIMAEKRDVKEFSQIVQIRDETITITGKSLDLVKTAKIVLNEFFNVIPTEERRDERSSSRPPTIEAVESEDEEPGIELVQPSISYNKQELMAMARSHFCRETPTTWTEIAKETPAVVRGQKGPGPP